MNKSDVLCSLANKFHIVQDFSSQLSVCKQHSGITSTVVDDFLLYYAAGKDKLEREMDQKFAPYRHILRRHAGTWHNYLKAQYIAHRIFRKGGLLRKYLNHSAIKNRSVVEREWLSQQLTNPWRFCFSEVIDNPAEHFYHMRDVFTGDAFLLYSPGTTTTMTEIRALLWFNLISYNGVCWQSFGPICGYQSFEPDDVFFFASEVGHDIESNTDVVADIENTPIPYMMLLSGGSIPITVARKHVMVYAITETEAPDFDIGTLKSHFDVSENNGVYRLSFQTWSEFPHFACAYYHERMQSLLLTAMTDVGYEKLVFKFNKLGYDLPTEPAIRLHPSMQLTIENILRTKIVLNPFEHLFQNSMMTDEQEDLDEMNSIMKVLTPYVNDRKSPDFNAIAMRENVDPLFVKEIFQTMMDRYHDLLSSLDEDT